MSLEFQVLLPEEYLIKHIETGSRPDGRKLEDRRPFSISAGNIKTADGSAIVKQGNTSVVCGIKAEITKPTAEQPDKGFIVPNVILPAMCHPNIKVGPPSPEAQDLSAFIKDVILSSGCISLTDLCPVVGKYAWVLYIDILCLDHDGNLRDASVAALVAAFHCLKLPKVIYDDEMEQITVSEVKEKLDVSCIPVCCSHALFFLDTGEVIGDDAREMTLVSDPSYAEQELADTLISIVTLNKGVICLTQQTGDRPLSESNLQKAISLASNHSNYIRKAISDII